MEFEFIRVEYDPQKQARGVILQNDGGYTIRWFKSPGDSAATYSSGPGPLGGLVVHFDVLRGKKPGDHVMRVQYHKAG